VSERYRQLCAKVDAFFARVEARHADQLNCHRGCYDCCDARLSITGVEATAVVAAWRELSDERRAEVRATWRPDATACAALDRQGRCAIYAGRPLVCRSHGVPIRFQQPGKSLPVVETCFRNFPATGALGGPAAADPDCVLDQTTLSAMLLLIDKEDALLSDRTPGERFELAELLADPPDPPRA
jgi:uncharacterized protein